MSDSPDTLYCANHPQTPTSLRCNRCEKPICIKCARLTPTGYRCKECVSGQQKTFDTAQWYDYPLVFVVSLVISFAGSWLATLLGFLVIFVAPIVGVVIAEANRRIINRRRSKPLFQLVAAATALGSLPLLGMALLGALVSVGAYGVEGWSSLAGVIWPGVYAIMVTSSVYYRMSGVTFR